MKGNVLVIDDLESARKRVTAALSKANFIDTVFEAGGLEDAIQVCEEASGNAQKIGAVILDLELPVGSAPDFAAEDSRKRGGIQVMEKLIGHGLLHSDTPIVIHSLYEFECDYDSLRHAKLNVIAKVDKFDTGFNGTEIRVWAARALWPNKLP